MLCMDCVGTGIPNWSMEVTATSVAHEMYELARVLCKQLDLDETFTGIQRVRGYFAPITYFPAVFNEKVALLAPSGLRTE